MQFPRWDTRTNLSPSKLVKEASHRPSVAVLLCREQMVMCASGIPQWSHFGPLARHPHEVRVRARQPQLPRLRTLRVQRKMNLDSAFNHLSDADASRHNQNQNGDPKGVPLHAVATIIKPLRDGPRRRIIKCLLQDHKSVAPKHKPLNLPFAVWKISTFRQPVVDQTRYMLLAQAPQPFRFLIFRPALRPKLRLRKEKGERPQRFLDNPRRK
jgi:hypothetical protein